ncbi:Os09g0508951, partial [Oryza sativa Japonica Group]
TASQLCETASRRRSIALRPPLAPTARRPRHRWSAILGSSQPHPHRLRRLVPPPSRDAVPPFRSAVSRPRRRPAVSPPLPPLTTTPQPHQGADDASPRSRSSQQPSGSSQQPSGSSQQPSYEPTSLNH